MSDAPIDPRWPKVLSLSVHEFRTPMTVVAGYIRMLLKDRAGALNDQQRRLLEEAEKSCAKLSALIAEVSELSNLEAGTAPFNMHQADLHAALRQAVEELPPLPDREVAIDLQIDAAGVPIQGDPVRLTQALASLIAALRREVIGDGPLTVLGRRTGAGYEIHIGDGEAIAALESEADRDRAPFDEWRGGVGLSLLVARRILQKHGARLLAAPGGRKAGGRVVFAAISNP
jgi:K+-sensing histidine kinase KdpD